MSNRFSRFRVFTGRSSKDTEERLAEVQISKRGGLANPYQEKPQPTGRATEGEAMEYSRFDHSHPTVIIEEGDSQIPYLNEIRFNSANQIVRWDGSNWVPMRTALPSNDLPNPVGGNPSAGTSDRYSRADHTHRIVLQPHSNLSNPVQRQLGTWSSGLDDVGEYVLAIRNFLDDRWEIPFCRPYIMQTNTAPSGKNFQSTSYGELVLRTDAGKQGILYFRRSGSTIWQPLGTILSLSTAHLGLVGELLRSSADITSTGQWFLRGVDNSGNVRALPLSIRTYNQNEKPTTNLPVNMGDAYGFFIQDRRLIELYPQQSDGVERPIIIPSYQTSIPVLPAYFFIPSGGNSIQESGVGGFPAVRFYGSTSNTNLPLIVSTISFFPMGIRKVRLGVLLRSGHTSGSFTYYFDLRINSINSNSNSMMMAGEFGASLAMNASSVAVYMTPILSVSLPSTYGDVWGVPFGFYFRRRWDLEASNSHDLYVVGFVLVAYRE